METQHTQTYRMLQKQSKEESFVVINVYFKKKERSKLSSLMLHLEEPQKEDQTKPKVIRKIEIIEIREKVK